MATQWDAIWINATLATCDEDMKLIQQGGIAISQGKIAWVGEMKDLSKSPEQCANKIYDATDFCITPGFIDCHTHLVFAGDRSSEFELRMQGKSYEEIAQQGGGIFSTVKSTRAISEEDLFKLSLARAQVMLTNGVTTLEIKSGYGLDDETECKILRVAQRIAETLPLTIRKTFLGAHALPPEFSPDPNAYIHFLCHKVIPKIAKEKLADAVDVFCDKIAFNLNQTERIFAAAQQFGLAVKCHAEQLSHTNVAVLAAQYHALSVDHLEYISEEGIVAIVKSDTVAVLLPGAYYFLQEKILPPIELLRKHAVPIALATDFNPGTSPILSLLLILNMGCVLFKMTFEECLAGVTRHAAKALGLEKSKGSLARNKDADFVIWNIKHPNELAYFLGSNPLMQLIQAGKIVIDRIK